MEEKLLALADLWEKSGRQMRGDGHQEVASALIGCAQALRNAIESP